ncbi:RNA polymerase sigma-70 factor, ECF subfamily protein [Amylibacter marinus]|uniref:RNA polymerase sigma-70 factor, ECF subfamily protein n=1 Tax=Amylibacter marinus TaxID=1475483 RepID=A0ABQ5VRW6_9RHOB|nr:RNA polymerase sigma factor [Amylibacter marinus]GLQ34080.1 RNA polymerase sigma-70 factor, ECF subfamily protein [Amylibacter marinus]
MTTAPDQIHRALDRVIRADRGRLVATLAHSLRDLDLAEDCFQEAITRALANWGKTGLPKSPQAWLLSVARRHAIDTLRRSKSFAQKSADIAMLTAEIAQETHEVSDIPDHRLRLIFTCCHPALDQSARVALTLQTLGGLTTPEIAAAFLVKTPTMAQRLTRAKSKISKAGIGFKIPEAADMAARMQSVLQVIYLIYNEGYRATKGCDLIRINLCEEALFLARLVVSFLPDEAEAQGLLALVLFSMARRHARTEESGKFVPLEDQDRSQWDKHMIFEAQNLLESALKKGRIGVYQLQAAIHGLHCQAETAEQTDWVQISHLYGLLAGIDGSAVVRLNQAVALGFSGQGAQALALIQQIEHLLADYQPLYAAKADVHRRNNQFEDAMHAYNRAIALSTLPAEVAFLQGRLEECRAEIGENSVAQKKRPSKARP